MSDLKKISKNSKAYFVGSGIASLAGAFFLIRDAKMQGENIYIYEEMKLTGGSCDGIGSKEKGYVIRGGRMLNYPAYECTWDLLNDIPALNDSDKSVMEEIIEFNNKIKTHSNARLVDKDGNVVDTNVMGFSTQDRIAMTKLIMTSEENLGVSKINENFPPSFFETNFWYMWVTTFAFQPWHSAVEFKRYMLRFFHEFPRIQTLEGVARTPYNQYDSLILPLLKVLKENKVNFVMGTTITDLDFKENVEEKIVKIIHLSKDGTESVNEIEETDLVFITNGSMTENSTIGSMTKAPETLNEGASFKLWEKIASKTSEVGNPKPFYSNVNESLWESFTVTCDDPLFFELMENFSRNKEGTGALVTFKDSNWFMSIVLAYQPHFINQPRDIKVFWGYSLFPNKIGNYVKKKMSECTGEEILIELCNHLKFEKHLDKIIKTSNCITCMMPFITSQFMPRKVNDRPKVIPNGSKNLAFIGQYCEIPDDVVFTVEYSVRSAQIAVYSLFGIKKPIPAINKHQYDIRILLKSLMTSFK